MPDLDTVLIDRKNKTVTVNGQVVHNADFNKIVTDHVAQEVYADNVRIWPPGARPG